jgi:Alginate lyase
MENRRIPEESSTMISVFARSATLAFLLFLVLAPVLTAAESAGTISPSPRVFLLEGNYLRVTQQRIRDGDKSLALALAELEGAAKSALRAGPFSVVEKTNVPPSGDKHDYMSIGPYFWPDPASSNGLPYVRHDGKRNPANRTSNRRDLASMIGNVETLALAWYFTGDEAYGDKASQLLRTWFLDPATRMNPNFEFAQAVPGVNTGRGIGLIEMAGMTSLVDSVGLLAGAKSWTDADQRGLQQWFTQFVQWMQESKNGRDEAAAKNNHGTYYDLELSMFALFIGKNEIATNVLRAVPAKRIARQIEPDGRQPLELARTNAWGYSVGNLRGLISLAQLGDKYGVDLWHYETADGRSIRKALDCLVAFANGEREWLPGRSGEPSLQSLAMHLRFAATKYSVPRHKELLSKLAPMDPSDRANLVRPKLPEK